MIPTNKPMDYGHAETDRQLKSLEQKLKKMYRQASQNAEDKFTTYMESFRKKDDRHRIDVETGKWTQKQYDDWRKNQLLYADTLQSIKETIADDLHNTDKMAIQMVREHQKDVYALNHNYGTYEVEHGAGVDTQYTLYDHDTVERLMRDDPKLLPPPSKKRQAEIDASDKKWNMDKLTSCFTASIVSGDSIPMMAKRISSVADMDRNSAIRNARTMTTGAENGGRIDSYLRAKAMGIDMKEEWVATLDGRTRHSHRNMDGEKIAVGEKFSNGLRFPGDPDGAPYEVYNCRCTIEASLTGIDSKAIDKSDVLQRKYGNKDITYEQWRDEHKRTQVLQAITTGSTGHKIAEGKDISTTWQRRPEQFDFEIEDVMDAQGFDGKPKIVSQEEFDRAVKEANNGEGFIAQRTYSAPDEETLQAYQDQLYDGKWYVDCSTGGAQYGQGMYCSADYTGTLTDGIKVEMEHYQQLGVSRNQIISAVNAENKYIETHLDLSDDATRLMYKLNVLGEENDDDGKDIFWKLSKISTDDRKKAQSNIAEVRKQAQQEKERILKMPPTEYAKRFSKIETMTLDPSSKVIKYNDISKLRQKMIDNAKTKHKQILKDNGWDEFDDEFDVEKKRWRQEESDIKNMDDGTLATLFGYDAINAEGHGQSGSYTVILNRTKCIILDNRK